MPEIPPAVQSLALYIHWPFCRKKCPYCDFNSHVRTEIDVLRWEKALLAELHFMASLMPEGILTSIFFGGGTPSLMPTNIAASLINTTQNLWQASPSLEITLEANPTSAESNNFKMLREAGVNRLSLGIQSLREKDLAFLGREHSVNEAFKALELAANIFPRYSFDLIYARPEQTVIAWEIELREACQYIGEHLSLYQLTIEPDTPFARFHKTGKFELPPEETAAKMYDLTSHILAEYGLSAYEISNYACPGKECRHNLTYWQGGAYLGIGPGAHGRLHTKDGWLATNTLKSPERWLAQVETKGHGLENKTILTNESRATEWLLTGLRTRDGIEKSAFKCGTNLSLDDIIDQQALQNFVKKGLITTTPTYLRSTSKGWLVLDYLLGKLLN